MEGYRREAEHKACVRARESGLDFQGFMALFTTNESFCVRAFQSKHSY